MPATPHEASAPVCGRFAPSPTGPLHFGSLVAALASWLSARHAGGHWLLRMEDIDPPREVPGAADSILSSLERLGLTWDGSVLYQRTRRDAYQAALEQLQADGHVFACGCNRKQIAAAGLRGPEGPVYPGTCRNGLPPGRSMRMLRVRVTDRDICFDDRCQGRQCQNLARDTGDFVVLRFDGIHAYQLAVVVDDAWQGITEVVRGCDLLLSTGRQIWLQELLGLPRPGYLHIPLAVRHDGPKLSKCAGDAPLDQWPPGELLAHALRFLGQPVPDEYAPDATMPLLDFALSRWNPERIPSRRRLPAPAIPLP